MKRLLILCLFLTACSANVSGWTRQTDSGVSHAADMHVNDDDLASVPDMKSRADLSTVHDMAHAADLGRTDAGCVHDGGRHKEE